MKKNQRILILDWMRKIHKMEWAHRYESVRWKKINLFLGITSLSLAVIISTIPTLPFLQEEPPPTINDSDTLLKTITSIGAIIIAIVSGLQTFLKPSEVAENFRAKSDEFEMLRHRLEEFIEFQLDDSKEIKIELEDIRKEWSNIGSLNTTDKNFNKAGARLRGLNRYSNKLTFSDDESPLENGS